MSHDDTIPTAAAPTETIDGTRVAFILSAGRTGTTFLGKVLPPLLPDVAFLQEPPGSRRLFMVSNALSAAGPDGLPVRWYRRLCRQRLDALGPGRKLVEINPFLVPIAHHLPTVVAPLDAVHMVRHPFGWIESMATFKAYGWRRRLVEHIPFALTRHRAADRWGDLSDLERWAWRWRLAVETNGAACAAARTTALVRYEDLFSPDIAVRQKTLDTILGIVAPGQHVDAARIAWDNSVNPAPTRSEAGAASWPSDIRRRVADIVGPLARAHGYDGEESWRE